MSADSASSGSGGTTVIHSARCSGRAAWALRMQMLPPAQDTAAKTQAMFGEAQQRTQAAMEKSSKLFEDMVAFNKDNLEAVVESSKIAAKGAQTLGQGAADYAKRSFETATQTLQTLSSVKSPTEFIELQTKLVKRDVSLKVLDASEPRQSGQLSKITINLKEGISSEDAKKISKLIRDEGPKGVKAQIQGDELRVSSKKRDDLQAVISLLKGEDFGIALQFVNYR